MKPIEIAQLCHNLNKAVCELYGDFHCPAWEDVPEETKIGAVLTIEHIIADPDLTPEDIHNSWMDFKIDNGWRHGPVIDAEKKTHPSIVPFCMLPEREQIKDRLFRAVVLSAIAK